MMIQGGSIFSRERNKGKGFHNFQKKEQGQFIDWTRPLLPFF